MTPLLVVNVHKCASGTPEYLASLGYDCALIEDFHVPAIQTVPDKEDRRFDAAVLALQGLLARGGVLGADTVARLAVAHADALLTELEKPK